MTKILTFTFLCTLFLTLTQAQPQELSPATAPTEEASASVPAVDLEKQLEATQAQIMSNPELVAEIQALMHDPEVMQILSDPDLLKAATAKDISAVEKNPQTQALMQNPKIQALTEKIKQQQNKN